KQPQTVLTTDEHLFWVDGKGWVPALNLLVGEYLFNEYGERVRISANQRLNGTAEVYTLKLRGDTAFYANGVLVHDLCGGNPQDTVAGERSPPQHRQFPLNFRNK